MLVGVLLMAGFLLAGGGLVAYGATKLVRRVRHARLREYRGTTVTGEVVDVVWRGSGQHSRGHPKVAFTDRHGVERTVVGETGTDGPPLPGTRLKVWYDPLDDTVPPVVTNDWRGVFVPVLAIVVGGFFLAFVGFALSSLLTSSFA
ncbi:DUF3592 domain-containing protein [Isoptericola sp. F-RaC21]|uniref:DUF3592 domain-containing protein n=1 Tax=Isoptericola sp. F-RaC21 TaxID=3141452 RepID=UPI00315C1E2F